jgi:hypothetical protein
VGVSEYCWTRIPVWSNPTGYGTNAVVFRCIGAPLVALTTRLAVPGSVGDKPESANHNPGTTEQKPVGADHELGSTLNHSWEVWEIIIFERNAARAPGNDRYNLSFNNL